MPALNFRGQFANTVEVGYKKQTIRPKRKCPIRVGDRLYLYTGMRTKQCRKLGEAICTAITPIHIERGNIQIAGEQLTTTNALALARKDGFPTLEQFYSFFRYYHGLPFDGIIIQWKGWA